MLPENDDGTWELDPAKAFATLGNETRINVLWALWDAGSPMSYAELRREVAPDDQGNFGYHLGQLTDHFITKSDEGYELRLAGEQVVRAILTGTITPGPSVDPVEVDDRCSFCGGSVEVSYDDETITIRCRVCGGLVGGPHPTGTFIHYEFPPSGLEGRSADEIVDAAHVHYDAKIIPMMHGICPECASQIDTEVEVCEDHELDEDGLCRTCGTRNEVWTVLTCERCRYSRLSVLWVVVLNHPAVISFLYEHGVEEQIPFRKLTWENARIARNVDVQILDTDPYRFRVTITVEDDRLVATVDDELSIDSVDRPPLSAND